MGFKIGSISSDKYNKTKEKEMRFGLNVIDDKGIRKVWHKKPKILWEDVAYIETEFIIDGYCIGYKTILYSNKTKFSFSFRISSVGKDGQIKEVHEHYLLLKLLLEHCSDILVDYRTEFILKWGEHLPKFEALNNKYNLQNENLMTAYKLACLYTLLLDYKEAKRILKEIVKKDPEDVKALTLLFFIKTKYGINTKAVDKLLKINPENSDLLTQAICMDSVPLEQQSYIDKLFKRRKGNFQVRLKLIDRYLWKKEYDIAKKHIGELRQEYENTAYKDAINRIIDYTIKYRTDINFRNKIDSHYETKVIFGGVVYVALMAFSIFYVIKQHKILLSLWLIIIVCIIKSVLLFFAIRIKYF